MSTVFCAVVTTRLSSITASLPLLTLLTCLFGIIIGARVSFREQVEEKSAYIGDSFAIEHVCESVGFGFCFDAVSPALTMLEKYRKMVSVNSCWLWGDLRTEYGRDTIM